jgi:anti-anti-sigma factor
MASAPRLQAVITSLIERGEQRILVDLYQLAFCDSAGLNAFVQGDKHCAARGGWLRVTRAQGHVARVLDLSGVGEVLGYRRERVPPT